MASGIFFQLDASHLVVVTLLGLGTTLVLPLVRVPLIKLQSQGATTVLPSCACNFTHLRPDLHSKGISARITTLGLLPASIVKKKS